MAIDINQWMPLDVNKMRTHSVLQNRQPCTQAEWSTKANSWWCQPSMTEHHHDNNSNQTTETTTNENRWTTEWTQVTWQNKTKQFQLRQQLQTWPRRIRSDHNEQFILSTFKINFVNLKSELLNLKSMFTCEYPSHSPQKKKVSTFYSNSSSRLLDSTLGRASYP